MDSLRVRLLGPLDVEGVSVSALRSRKARSLVRLLALGRGRPVSVDRLIDCLWGDDPPASPQRDLSAHVSRIRSLVGAEWVARSDAGYTLLLDWLDLAELDELAAAARSAFDAGNHIVAGNAADAALALVRGPALSDEDGGWWVDEERAAVERTVTELHRVGAEAALAAGNVGEATARAEAALEADPYDEVALRVLMSAHARSGRPGSASAAYDKFRERLADDLGLSPSRETDAVHGAIVTGEFGPSDKASEHRPSAGLPGREAELARLEAAIAESPATVRVVQVEGEAGIGKTALLDALAGQAGDALVLRGRCDETGQSLPLHPVADAIADHLAGLGRAAAQELLGDDSALLDPLLGLTGTPSVTPLIGDLDAARQSAFAALLRLVERAGGGRAVVVLIDDAHLADPSTVAWLRFVGRRPVAASVLVVAARRPGEGAKLPADTTVPIGPVDLPAARMIVGDDRAEALFDRSGGHPLFLVELAAAEGDVVPASIKDVVGQRCERAGVAAATLRTAAVLGPQADPDLLASALRIPALTVLDHLEEGVRRQLLAERAGRFVFRHELVREALVESTTAARRSLLHRAAAEVLAHRTPRDPTAIAHHARLAGDRDHAATALADAGILAAGRHAYAEATAAFDESIALADNSAARVARARLRVSRGELQGADRDAVVAQGLGAGAEALEVRAWTARFTRDAAGAIAFGAEGARTATDSATRASCLLVMGMAHRGRGELSLAEQALEEVAELEADAGVGPISAYLAIDRVHQGSAREALARVEPALAVDVGLAHGLPTEHALQAAAHAHGLLGRPAAALAAIDRMTRVMDEHGTVWRYRGLDDNYRSWVLRNLGDPAAEDLSARAMEEGPNLEVVAQASLDLADGLLRSGNVSAAADALRRADEVAAAEDFDKRWRYDQRAALLRARVELASGDAQRALEGAAAAATGATERADARYVALASILAARARRLLGEPVDPEAVAAHLRVLPEVAGLEAWWVTAEAAADFDIDQWWALAERRIAGIAAAAGDDGQAFQARARRSLDERRSGVRATKRTTGGA